MNIFYSKDSFKNIGPWFQESKKLDENDDQGKYWFEDIS